MRPACVELSAVALRFKGQQATIKQILHALQDVQGTLERPQIQAALDEKLSEYTFFPLTHVFNQSQALSPTCIEAAIRCVTVLVSKGWREQISTEMGKQLLILMSLLAGGQTKTGNAAPTEELKAVAFTCIGAVTTALAARSDGHQLFNDLAARSVTDQLAYLLLESVTDSVSDEVQLAASNALIAIVAAITDRVVLASLLPRTASSLTQALRISTKARRTKKVLCSYLVLLKMLLQAVLADDAVYPLQTVQSGSHVDVLDESWLRATSEQVKLALLQVFRLRSHADVEVRDTLADLCFMIIEACPKSLFSTQSIAVESLIYLSQFDDAQGTRSSLEFLVSAQVSVAEMVFEKLYEWCQSMPRTMQMKEDRPKEQLFGLIGAALSLSSDTVQVSDEAISRFVSGLVEGLKMLNSSTSKANFLAEQASPGLLARLDLDSPATQQAFGQLVLARPNEERTAHQLHNLLGVLSRKGYAHRMAQMCLKQSVDTGWHEQLYFAWLALQCLLRTKHDTFDMSSFLVLDDEDIRSTSRPRLVSDLYSTALPWLTEDDYGAESSDWRFGAVAIECTVMQAEQLNVSYRPELLDTLFPILSLLGSSTTQLREHAIIGLDRLATACGYDSTGDMLVDNADYLINSVSMKLNAFDITPQAPQVLLMMIRLCGARIIPQLDDLIGSMFSALDNFHGYPLLVGTLFQVLRAIVDESKKQPQLMLTNDMREPQHYRSAIVASSMLDILNDLRRRRRREKVAMDQESRQLESAPQVPWQSSDVDVGHRGDDSGSDAAREADDEAANSPVRDEAKAIPKPYKLLLSIAQATGPHLTSPSPQVRQTLLQLLDDVAPLLAHDEDSFLPLINSVWPVVVPRLLAYVPESADNDDETAYNACAAADVIATLCRTAGSFMSSRIDDLLSHVQKLFQGVQGRRPTKSGERSTRSQVLAALIRLMSTILSYVRLSEDGGDQIADTLFPFATGPGQEGVRKALGSYNPDALWLWDHDR